MSFFYEKIKLNNKKLKLQVILILSQSTCCILNSASDAEYNGYWGIGTITPGGLPETSAISSFSTDWKHCGMN